MDDGHIHTHMPFLDAASSSDQWIATGTTTDLSHRCWTTFSTQAGYSIFSYNGTSIVPPIKGSGHSSMFVADWHTSFLGIILP
jgi:hypothetical protein